MSNEQLELLKELNRAIQETHAARLRLNEELDELAAMLTEHVKRERRGTSYMLSVGAFLFGAVLARLFESFATG